MDREGDRYHTMVNLCSILASTPKIGREMWLREVGIRVAIQNKTLSLVSSGSEEPPEEYPHRPSPSSPALILSQGKPEECSQVIVLSRLDISSSNLKTFAHHPLIYDCRPKTLADTSY